MVFCCRFSGLGWTFILNLRILIKCLGYILIFWVLFSSMLPCSVLDGCEDEHTMEQSSRPEKHNDCSNCSPFSICSVYHGCVINPANIGLTVPGTYIVQAYPDFYIGTRSDYHARLFQPPRV
ncbi:hypothetical protein SAMN04487894_107151 [Niabella drilacis]|uniref:Uncharacterized protein n=1 Tax=Niabella drilacis (strain DSM 25811 / CCM 8410 / CCUG 62505 / LMG 26954 / E90) TaxID=1285928 RepID=A0A1G6TC55_NIADE|nr:hypothetical protein SAMN04487894_107151 [Niabella drilacis]